MKDFFQGNGGVETGTDGDEPCGNRRLARLVELQEALLGPGTPAVKARLITDTLVEMLDADFVRLWMVRAGDRCDGWCIYSRSDDPVHVCRDRSKCLHLTASSGRYTAVDSATHTRVPFGCYKIGRVACGDIPGFLTNDVVHDPRIHDHAWAEELGLQSFAGYPLMSVSGEPVGVLALFSRHVLSAEDEALIRSVAAAAAQVLQTAQAEEKLERAKAGLEDMVRERTLELIRTNNDLQLEIERGETARRESRAVSRRLAEIIEFLPDATFVIDKERRVIAWNRAIEEMTGVPKEDILGKGDYAYSLPFYGERRPVLIDLVVADAGDVEIMYDMVTRDGDTLFSEVFCPLIGAGRGACLWVTASPLFDENGEPSGAVESIRDVTARKQAEQALIVSEDNYRSIFENAVEGIFQAFPDSRINNANPAMARILGCESETELLSSGIALKEVFQDPDAWGEIMDTLEAGRRVLRREVNIVRRNGEPAWISLNAVIASGKGGKEYYIEGTMSDTTRRRLAEQGFDRQKAMFTQLFDNSPRAIVMFDEYGTVMDVNPSFVELFGYGPEEITSDPSSVIPGDRVEQGLDFRKRILAGQVLNDETVRMHKSGREVPVSVLGFPFRFEGRIAGGFIVYGDISKRKKYERRLTHLALHDGLTGLPNRTLFMDRLKGAMERGKRWKESTFAVLMCDLDRFKRVNDSLGHSAGDALLKQVARRIAEAVRSADTVARLGGDEFAVLLEECRSPGEAVAVTRRILQRIREPLDINGQFIRVGCSIGMVLKTVGYDQPEDILRDADISMYRAKESGRDRFKAFNRIMHEQAVRAVRLEDDIRRGIGCGELYPVFQPILCAESLTPLGFEALLRWNHPERGLIMPSEIIGVAEETELIELIGAYILEDACRTMAGWRETVPGAENMYLAVNLSARQFSQGNLVEMVRDILKRTGFPAANLKLEVTETVIMRNEDVALAKLNRLQEMGVDIAVDDFGTGWSSLQALQRYPVSTLKIDRGFVGKMATDPGSLEIVRSVVYLGRGLGVDVVAEGVEEEVQLQLLRMIGCAQVQGFLFHPPLKKDQAELLLRSAKLRKWR